jgi:hypothetical protein
MPLGIVECVLHVGETGSERPQFMYLVNVDMGGIDCVEQSRSPRWREWRGSKNCPSAGIGTLE